MKELFHLLGRNAFLNTEVICAVFISFFFAILFLQSGLDKIFNYKSELVWTKEHFSKSILSRLASFMFYVLILLELITGVISLIAPFLFWFTGDPICFFFSNVLSCLTLLALFFGQRVAKDYAGAVSLTGYFIVSIIGIYLSL